jgi:hypothetical protein
VTLRLPGGVLAAYVDPLAIKRKEPLQEEVQTHEDKQAGPDSAEEARRERAPKPQREDEDQDPGEVRNESVVDPRV